MNILDIQQTAHSSAVNLDPIYQMKRFGINVVFKLYECRIR
jgi:hypothetical protein